MKKANAVTDHILMKSYGKIYSYLYDHAYPAALVDIGEKVIKKDLRTMDRLQRVLEDLIASDREYAAYAVWYYKFNRLKMLDTIKTDEEMLDYLDSLCRDA
jgi:hypothetical protein